MKVVVELANATAVSGLAVDKHSQVIAVAGDNHTSVYETADRPWLDRIDTGAFTTQSIDVAADGAMAWGDDNGKLHIRAAAEPYGVTTVAAHTGQITSVAFSREGAEIVTAGFDGAVRVWGRDGTLIRTVATGLGNLWSACFSPDGTMIAAGARGGHVYLWKEHGGAPVSMDCDTDRVPMVRFNPHGTSLLCGIGIVGDGAEVWDVASEKRIHRLEGQGGSVRAVAYSPDGTLMVTGADNRTVRVWDASTGELLRVIEGLPWSPFDLKFHPDGRVLFVVGRGGELVVLDPHAGEQIAVLKVHEWSVFAICVSSDGRRLITSGEDPWIGITDLDHIRGYIRGNEAYWKDELDKRRK